MQTRNKAWIAAPLMAAALATGCTALTHGSGAADASSGGHAVATSSAGVVGKQIVKKCVPQNGLAQARWFRYMAAGKHSKVAEKGRETREAFAACAGVPPSQMKAFENKVLTDAENAAKLAVTSKTVTLKGATKTFLETTLPDDVVIYRAR